MRIPCATSQRNIPTKKIRESNTRPGTDQYGFFLDSNDNKFRNLNNDCEYRVLMIGGSTVEGQDLKNLDDTIPARLEKLYQQYFESKKINVINAGVQGYYSAQEISRLIFYIIPNVKFNHVIFFHGTNDFEHNPSIRLTGVDMNYNGDGFYTTISPFSFTENLIWGDFQNILNELKGS